LIIDPDNPLIFFWCLKGFYILGLSKPGILGRKPLGWEGDQKWVKIFLLNIYNKLSYLRLLKLETALFGKNIFTADQKVRLKRKGVIYFY
jgi:hypothetical protein